MFFSAKKGDYMSLFEIDKECIKQREYVNIPAWHDAGYLGEGLTIFCDDTEKDHHDECVADIIQVGLPMAKVLTGSIGYTIKNGVVQEARITCTQTGETLQFDEFIKKYNVSSINNSKNGNDGKKDRPESVFMAQKIKEYNLIVTGAAGNIYEGYIENIYYGSAIIVGSANLINNKAVYGMKAIGEGIDFVTFHGWQPGTSFSSPFLHIQCGLLRSKYGRKLTQEEAYEYLKNHSEDMRMPGHDIFTGWGIPIMGSTETTIIMQIGSKKMLVDGRTVDLDQEPVQDTKTWRTLVPLRAIAEAFGAEVLWDNKNKMITIIK